MKRFALHMMILAAMAAVGGAAVVGFGLFNVSARQGHWPGVSWVLHTTYRNSVALRAPPADTVPDLASEDLIALGARHYDNACRMCHGTPQGPQSATVEAMVPRPLPIAQAVSQWEPRHLFWIVENGVKMSGMPAWPAERRDDDVWSVVAFLNAVPQIDPENYAALVAPPEGADDDIAYCAVCHGRDGTGRANAQVPRIDILSETYLAASLEAYRSGARSSGIMQQAASELSDADIARLARHYAKRTAGPTLELVAEVSSADLVETGRKLAMGEAGSMDVPACRACHGPWPSRRSPLFPNLEGQHANYLATQLHLWRDGERGGSPRANLMHQAATDLTDDEIQALAAYYASLQATKN